MPILANITQLPNGFQLETFKSSGELINENVYSRALDLDASNSPNISLIDPQNRLSILPPTDFLQITINGAVAPLIYDDFLLAVASVIYSKIGGGGANKVTGATAGDLASLTADGDLADSGVSVSTDNTLGGATPLDTKLPTQKAIREFFANSSLNFWDTRGQWDASTGLFPTIGGSGIAGAVMKNDLWVISVAGTIGGKNLKIGDVIIALVDSPAQILANWNTQTTVYDYVPAKAQAFDATNIYVNAVNGVDTNTGASDSPFLTVQKALSVLSTVGSTIHIISNNSLSISNITIPSITNSIVIKGYSVNQFGGTNTNKYIKFTNLNVFSTTGKIILENISIEDFVCNCSVNLVNCEVRGSINYTANNSYISYQQVNFINSTHTFNHNGLQSGLWEEYPDCEGATLSLPLVLESVISTLLTPPAINFLGDRYLTVGGTPTGVWSTQGNKIASWNGTTWIYQPLVSGNIVTTQDATPLSYQYNGTTWVQISKWVISTKIADEVSEGLEDTNTYTKVLFISSNVDIKASENNKLYKLTYNPTSTFYEFTIPPEFRSSNIVLEVLTPAITNIPINYPTSTLIAGNVVITLPDLENVVGKTSFGYDLDQFTISVPTNVANIDNIVIKAPNGRNFYETTTNTSISGSIGIVISSGTDITFRWSDPNEDPNYRLKPIQWKY
jgi:hypothetical protein